MATFSDWSSTASENETIDGVDISEGCPPANINNAVRSIMAAAKTQDDNKADGTLYTTKTDTEVSTNAKVTGRGALLHHNDTANASGRIFVRATGAETPTMSNGDILFEY